MKKTTVGNLSIKVYDSRAEMGAAAGAAGAKKIKEILNRKSEIDVMFAAAPSQNEVLEYLKNDTEIDFSRVNAYHMDEYIGLSADAPQSFGNFLKERLFSRVNFKHVYYMGSHADGAAACARYTEKLKDRHMDICFMGIGENGHIAFNDPSVADFEDTALVKMVALEAMCRQQQVNDGCFGSLDEVPTHAVTVTIPYMMKSDHLICTVPGSTKADAVLSTVTEGITTACPATIMRHHPSAVLYLDSDAAAKLDKTMFK